MPSAVRMRGCSIACTERCETNNTCTACTYNIIMYAATAREHRNATVSDRASPQMGKDHDGCQYSRWRGSDSDSVPNPKFEFGSFRGPRNRIRFGFSIQEPDWVRVARPRGRIRFGLPLPGSDSVRRPVRFGFCIRTRHRTPTLGLNLGLNPPQKIPGLNLGLNRRNLGVV